MFTITHTQVTPDILALFNLSKPTMPRAFNVLEGITRGEIFVQHPAHPTWAVVREPAYGALYFGGKIDAPLVAMLLDHFRQFDDVGIGCRVDDPLNRMLPPHPDYDGFTLYFTERSAHTALTPLIEQLPAQYVLATRDERLLAQSVDYDSNLALFGAVDRVLAHTVGVVLVHGETLICEAATGAPTHGRIEVGVTTAENYRQRGFATIACARLIEICESQGYATWWDCAKQNTASRPTGTKTGISE